MNRIERINAVMADARRLFIEAAPAFAVRLSSMIGGTRVIREVDLYSVSLVAERPNPKTGAGLIVSVEPHETPGGGDA